MQTQIGYINLNGGLDLVTPALNLPAGYLIDALNYLPSVNGGYERMAGYERFDGRVSPSARTFTDLVIHGAGFVMEETITGMTSQATGTLVYYDDQTLTLCGVTGTFLEGEPIESVSGQGEIQAVIDGGDTAFDESPQKYQAVETWYRQQITQPAGTGPIEGVFEFSGRVYAVRSDGIESHLYQSSMDGWIPIALHKVMRYQGAGSGLPEEGATITGDESVNTATVLRTIRQGGSADDLTVSGYLLLDKDSITGELLNGEGIVTGEYNAGELDAVTHHRLVVKSTPELKLYPKVGDTIQNKAGDYTATLVESINSTVVDELTIEIELMVSGAVGILNVDDEVWFKAKKAQASDPEPTPSQIGTLTEKPENCYKLLPLDPLKLPYPGDRLVFPLGRAILANRITITQEEGDHHYLTLNDITGTINLSDSVLVKLLAGYVDGDITQIQIAPGGQFEVVEHNFYATSEYRRIYACNGKDPAFEFDGTLLLPILTINPEDVNNPCCIEVHKDHLFLGFEAGFIRHSVVGEPLNFNGEIGAAEIGIGDGVTELHSLPGGALMIASKDTTQGLYGSTIADWQKSIVAKDVGALHRSCQNIGNTYYLDHNGITDLRRVETFGNYEAATVSRRIQPLINSFRQLGFVGTAAFREKNQIRFYYRKGYALVLKPEDNGSPQIMPLQYGHDITTLHSTEDEQGNNVVYLGTADGWILRDDTGTSFDGEAIESLIKTGYTHFDTPTLRKTFKRLELESGQVTENATIKVHAELDMAGGHTNTPSVNDISMFGGVGHWEVSDWNEFYWSANSVGNNSVGLDGTGRNLSLMFYQKDAWTRPFTLQSLLIHYMPRRLDRG